MAPVEELRIDPTRWGEAIAATEGPQLVVAGPGAGKTGFLARRALHLIDTALATPEQVLILGSSRAGAADLRSRVASLLDRSYTSIPAHTFHSLALHLVEEHGEDGSGPGAAPTLLTGPEQVALVADLLRDEDPGRWPLIHRSLLGTTVFAREVADFLLRCGERLIAVPELAERAGARPEWRALPGFLARYRTELTRRRRIDYGSLQAAAVGILGLPGLGGSIAERHRYVLVDEYQDTTTAQVRLLQHLIGSRRNLTAAGDPYQSIHSFRGAEIANTASFPDDFPDAAGNPARRIVLTTSFRVPAAILDAAARVTTGLDLPGAAGPVIPAPGRGSVEAYGFDQPTAEAEWIAAEAERIHLREEIPYGRIAALVRSKGRALVELTRALETRGIPYQAPDSRLADHPAVRCLLDLVRAAADEDGARGATIGRVLLGPLMGLPISSLRDLQRRRACGGEPWTALLRGVVPGGEALAGLLEEPGWATSLPAAEGFWHLWSSLPGLPEMALAGEGASRRAAWSSLGQVLDRLGERDPDATLADYLEWSETEDFEATPLLEFLPGAGDHLSIATMHQARGRRWDVVFIADAGEGVFPDLRRRESLLGSRHLSVSQPAHPADYRRFRLQEETRLAYAAMCRADIRVVWTCTTTRSPEGPSLPSRFISRVLGQDPGPAVPPPPGDPGLPSTPAEAEAWLRRLLGDPAAPAARRLAALHLIAAPAPRLPRPPDQFAGVPHRGSDRGLATHVAAFSPSQAEAYLTCPRLYAFRRRLHVDAADSTHLDFGRLVHSVLERVEAAAAESGEPHGSEAAALDTLDGLFDPAVFGGAPRAASWHRRAARMLAHLYRNWPSRGRVVLVEADVEAEVDGARWRGRIDRIEVEERADGTRRLKIVDYKTGSSLPGVDEASRSVQLGFYALAVAGDPRLGALGEVAAAEMWFPAADQKKVAVRSLDPGRLDEVKEAMRRAVEGIRSEDWAPQPGPACRRCPVRTVCPEWPEGRESFRG